MECFLSSLGYFLQVHSDPAHHSLAQREALTLLVPELNQLQSSQWTRCGHSQAAQGLPSQQRYARPNGGS